MAGVEDWLFWTPHGALSKRERSTTQGNPRRVALSQSDPDEQAHSTLFDSGSTPRSDLEDFDWSCDPSKSSGFKGFGSEL